MELNPGLAAAQANCELAEKAKRDRYREIAEQFNEFGAIKRAEGDLDAALQGFEKAIELNPGFAEAYNRQRRKKSKGDPARAMADFNKAINPGPGFADAYTNRGLVKKLNSDRAGAMADYDKAIEGSNRTRQWRTIIAAI